MRIISYIIFTVLFNTFHSIAQNINYRHGSFENGLLFESALTKLEKKPWIFTNTNSIEIGHKATQNYILIDLQIINELKENLILEIEDSNLDSVICINRNGLKIIGLNGDWIKNKDKTGQYQLPTFNISNKDSVELLLKIVKKEGGIIIPINVSTPDVYTKRSTNRDAFAFFYIGSLSILFIIIIVFYAVLHSKLYLLYSYYVLSVIIYYFSTYQYGNQYLWVDQPQLNDWFRAIMASIVFYAYVNFSLHFLALKSHFLRLSQIINLIPAAGLFFIIFAGPFSPFPKSVNNLFFHFFNFLVALFLVLILVSTILLFKKKNEVIKIYAIAIFPIFVAVINSVAMENGLVSKNLLLKNSLWIASIIESICFLIFITIRNKEIFEEKVNLEKDMVLKELKLLEIERIISQKEKSSLSSQIHDKILPFLIIVRRRFEVEKSLIGEEKKYLNQVIGDLRDISHDLSPKLRTDNDLEKSLLRLVDVEPVIKININFNWPENLLHDEFKDDVHMIFAELFANSIKHSKCTEIQTKFEEVNNYLHFLYQDNGIGYEVNDLNNNGIGIKNIIQKAIKNNGTINFDNLQKFKTIVNIKFKLDSFTFR